MDDTSINVWGLLAAVVSSFFVGGIWYSPLLFLKPWMKMAHVKETEFKKGFGKAMAGDLLTSSLMAFVLLHSIRFAGATDLVHGLCVAFWNWLGFVFTVQLGSVTYERKPFRYLAINSGYRLVSMLVMGAILTMWN